MIPVSPGREGWFLFLFVAQYLGGIGALMALSGINELEVWDSVRLVAPLIIVAAANAILLVEGIPMVSEQFLRRREARGEARGQARGEAQGEERGRRENQKLWEEWNRRRLEAEEKGEEFNEPPPGSD